MWIWLLFLRVALSAPTDSRCSIIDNAEFPCSDDAYKMAIVPGNSSPKTLQSVPQIQLSDIVSEESDLYKSFLGYMDKEMTSKDLTFNIYDDNIRNATVTFFNILLEMPPENYLKARTWANQNINDHMLDYAKRMLGIYKNNFGCKANGAPFFARPNFFVNSETYIKAVELKNGKLTNENSTVNQYMKTYTGYVINTNYSNWNYPDTECEKLDYFTEDIGLNSYYYGVHLLHPFWMSNSYLDEVNPRHAEHYYFRHQQLLARFLLEKENMKQRNVSRSKNCDAQYNPNLIYENGLQFPIRSNIQGEWSDDKAKIKAIDIAIRECLTRGVFVMENGTTVKLTEENHIDLISKLIRANYDGINTAKIVRSLYGYGRNGYPTDRYNPSPSVLHQPETTLRDPAIWYLLQGLYNYFVDFQTTLEPFDMSQHEVEDFFISENNFTKLITYFDYYQFYMDHDMPLPITARLRRLKNEPITLNFTVVSKKDRDVAVRIFLGPRCDDEDCWENIGKFYQVDAYLYSLLQGINVISWSPLTSHKLSFDDVYNLEPRKRSPLEKYNLFKFPANLILPKGLKEGLNLTLFVIMTTTENVKLRLFHDDSIYYNYVTYEIDEKPLGFPFHMPSKNHNKGANNYRFYNITIYHKKLRNVYDTAYYSTHLY